MKVKVQFEMDLPSPKYSDTISDDPEFITRMIWVAIENHKDWHLGKGADPIEECVFYGSKMMNTKVEVTK